MTIPLLDFHLHAAAVAPGTMAVRNRFPGEPPPERGPFSLGLHPWQVVADRLEADLAAVATGIRHPRCLAVGECGLDHLCTTPRANQQRAFTAQVALAVAADRPIIIHSVKAWAEIIAAKQDSLSKRPWIIHAFRGQRNLALDLIRHGFMLSFGTALTLAPTMREALAAIPPTSFFLETDDAPGADLAELYRVAAVARGVSVPDLARQILANFAQALGRRSHPTP